MPKPLLVDPLVGGALKKLHCTASSGFDAKDGVNQVYSGRNMSSGNSEDGGGDMAVLSVNANCDGSSVEEEKAEEQTRVPESSNGGFVPNESCSSAFGSSELSAISSDLILQPLLNESDGEGESGEIDHTGRGPVSSPDRARRSTHLEHTPGLQQDALQDGDMPVGQNGSGACGGGGKDSTVDQSVADLSTQSNEWERLGARPRDRPRDRAPMKRFPVEPSLFDLVPQEVASPVTHGVADAFLAKHSIDESLYQGSTEPRGPPAALPSANSGGSMLNRDFGSGSVEPTGNSLLTLKQRVEKARAMVERVLREREERELFGREIEKKEREIRELRARERREREARELEEANRWPQEQEAITGRSQWLCEHYQRHHRVRRPCCSHFYLCHRCHNNSRWMQLTEVPLPFDDLIVGSLDSNHNSADARRRFAKAMTRIQQARNTEEASRCCCTCTSEESKLLERQVLSAVGRQKYSTAVDSL
ncbi:hypothetical protein OS493_006136 [Desmophyllum pertusum]|uniref:CHY-type domain-containing protein n=1 Tax=Desmophyllum pertusum TaxID=174260 RepID=A0A9X0A523_9CNID|nr:hypothetical protein OS493_006136 [Desmophyllum pertusum]